jgi:hypothetical protein
MPFAPSRMIMSAVVPAGGGGGGPTTGLTVTPKFWVTGLLLALGSLVFTVTVSLSALAFL